MNTNNLHSFPEQNAIQTLRLFEDWIQVISAHYSKKNTIQPYELEDLQQFIKSRLLEQLPKIKANFKGQSKLRTYISAIILNLCREFRRKNCSKSILTNSDIKDHLYQQSDTSNKVEHKLAIEYEIKQLNQIFTLFGTQSDKVKLALKLYYGITVKQEDVLRYCEDVTSTLEEIESQKPLKKQEALVILTNLFNRKEGKSNSTEATRKWIARLIEEILTLLNNGQSNHTKETLGLLLETNEHK